VDEVTHPPAGGTTHRPAPVLPRRRQRPPRGDAMRRRSWICAVGGGTGRSLR